MIVARPPPGDGTGEAALLMKTSIIGFLHDSYFSREKSQQYTVTLRARPSKASAHASVRVFLCYSVR